jgi:hypothetical protein
MTDDKNSDKNMKDTISITFSGYKNAPEYPSWKDEFYRELIA